jgi:hypothetical protein
MRGQFLACLADKAAAPRRPVQAMACHDTRLLALLFQQTAHKVVLAGLDASEQPLWPAASGQSIWEQAACARHAQAALVGTVIKCGEDDDPIGVCTVLNLRQHSKLKALEELKAFLLAHCPDDASKEALTEVFAPTCWAGALALCRRRGLPGGPAARRHH